jgi:hypothetical protein
LGSLLLVVLVRLASQLHRPPLGRLLLHHHHLLSALPT